jgi:hypothetical protein
MDAEKPPGCVSCGNSMTFAGRISLPPEIIYRCEPCRTEIWIGHHSPPTIRPTEQPQAQQQQQPRPTKTLQGEEPI